MSVLIAGVGNVFRGDDGFGCEVLRRIAAGPLPAGVVARDFGTAAFDLQLWIERHDAVIVVDVVARGRAPGALSILEPSASDRPHEVTTPHGFDGTAVLAWAAARRDRGETPHTLRLVGCEPATFGDEDEGALGLSPAVEASVERAAAWAVELAALLAQGSGALPEEGACTSSV